MIKEKDTKGLILMKSIEINATFVDTMLRYSPSGNLLPIIKFKNVTDIYGKKLSKYAWANYGHGLQKLGILSYGDHINMFCKALVHQAKGFVYIKVPRRPNLALESDYIHPKLPIKNTYELVNRIIKDHPSRYSSVKKKSPIRY